MSRDSRHLLAKQTVASLGLTQHYWGESISFHLLKLKDVAGNRLALYSNDYRKLARTTQALYNKHPDKLSNNEVLYAIEHSAPENRVQLAYYFSADIRSHYELAAITEDGDIINVSDNALPKLEKIAGVTPQQNIIVMTGNRIYVHPKIRAKTGSIASNPTIPKFTTPDSLIDAPSEVPIPEDPAILGVYHSSFSNGERLQFAGLLEFREDKGWVIQNLSGHFEPHISQLPSIIEAMAKSGIDLSKLTVEAWIPKVPGVRSIKPEDHHIHLKRADVFLDETLRSKAASTHKLAAARAAITAAHTGSGSGQGHIDTPSGHTL